MGPNTDHCGTPEVIWILSDVAPSSMTRCVRDVKNEFIQFSTILFMPYYLSFSARCLWETLSKALLKSRMMTSVCLR